MKYIAMTLLHNLVLRKALVLCLVLVLIVTLVVPRPAKAQLFLAQIVSLLQAVYDIIRNDLGEVLNQITGLNEWLREFYQAFLFPKKAIEAARAFVDWMSDAFNKLIHETLRGNVMSSTLPASQTLEALLRNGSLDFNQLAERYRTVYGAVPSAADASPLDRNLIDVDDAMALNSMKSLGASEATINLSLGAASEMENKIKDPESAPGAAPFISAAGTVASIQTQAMIQKMIATQIRQEAALLAHHNTLLKRDALLASEVRGSIRQLLNKR